MPIELPSIGAFSMLLWEIEVIEYKGEPHG
jgi:hypothetical protein